MATFSQLISVTGALLFAGSPLTNYAQQSQYYRILGPVPTTFTHVSPEGNVTWTNRATNAMFLVQKATSLSSELNWVDYFQAAVTDAVTVYRSCRSTISVANGSIFCARR